MSLTPLTTRQNVANRLSAVALAQHVDHDPTNALTEAIDAATADVAFYLASRFTPDEMAGNQWVTSVTTHRAVMWVCQWRNNPLPRGMQEQWEEYVKLLEGLVIGKYQLPGLSIGDGRAPQLVHTRADYRRTRSQRVTRQGTTNYPTGYVRRMDGTEPQE
jgi:phage gp36-like protein